MMDLRTPYFIIDESGLRENIEGLNKSLIKYWNNYIIGYSCKTNSLPWIMNFMRKNNCYAEVVSDYEFELAKRVEFLDNKIIFNGPNKGKEKFIYALKNKSIVNIDSSREIQWLKEEKFNEEIRIGIRVNFDLDKYCPNETSFGRDGSRFGFSLENGALKKAIDQLNGINNVKVVGIHIHYTAKTRSLAVYKVLAQKACEVSKLFDHELEYIDIGGGFFGGVPNKPQYDDYMKVISEELSKEFNSENTKLIVEPGSAIIGSPVDFICEVVDVKDTFAKRIITVNGSRNKKENLIPEQIICGYTCLDYDRILKIDNSKELTIGDKITFKKVGAYTMSLSPLFIEYFPTVYIKRSNGDIECTRKRWRVDEYIQRCEW